MPELPEVETVRQGLTDFIVGRQISGLKINWSKSFNEPLEKLNKSVVNSKISAVKRRGKVIIIELSSGYSLLVHLKMTGQMVYRSPSLNFGAGHPNDSLVGKLPDNSTRVIFNFKEGGKLFFNDQRKFGWIRLVKTTKVAKHPVITKLGPEPFDPKLSARIFRQILNKRAKSSIKAVLLDQQIIAGIGNIYADESLWLAKIHPLTRVQNISTSKLNKLLVQIQDILKLALEKGGSTDRNYLQVDGQKGSYLSFAKVFHRQGLACYRCNSTILKIRAAGWGTHYCPKCQRLISG